MSSNTGVTLYRHPNDLHKMNSHTHAGRGSEGEAYLLGWKRRNGLGKEKRWARLADRTGGEEIPWGEVSQGAPVHMEDRVQNFRLKLHGYTVICGVVPEA